MLEEFFPGNIVGASVNRLTGKTDQIRMQNDFTEKMANTAYQRQIKDMKEAGLNPALMYAGGGGANGATGYSSTGTGGGLGEIAAVVNSASNLINSATMKNKMLNDIEFKSSAQQTTTDIYDNMGRLISTAVRIAKKF